MIRVPSSAYVWFDTEYTGLDLERARLLQVAAVVTDHELKRISSPADDLMLFIKLPKSVKVSPWIRDNMPDLLATCRSDEAVDVTEADARLAAFVDRHVVVPMGEDKRKPVLAGNSIHADWWLARKYLPTFLSRLHYRQLDVTALKLQWQDWFKGEEFDKENAGLIREHFPEVSLPAGKKQHDAYYDCQASVAELAYYRARLT